MDQLAQEHPHVQVVVGVYEALRRAAHVVADLGLVHQRGHLPVLRKAHVGQRNVIAFCPFLIAHIETCHFLALESKGLLDRLVEVQEGLVAADLDVAKGFALIVDQHTEAVDDHGSGAGGG